MKPTIILIIKLTCVIYFFTFSISTKLIAQSFFKRTVATGFNSAWEVVCGPNSLWVTENKAYTTSKVDIATGAKTVLVDLRATDPSINFPSSRGTQPPGVYTFKLYNIWIRDADRKGH